MMDAEVMRRPIYRYVSFCCRSFSSFKTYHPAITALPVDDPSGDLSSRLNDQQAAEALCKLEHRCAIPQRVVPGADGGALKQPLASKYPLVESLEF
jgi:hypothetical protein